MYKGMRKTLANNNNNFNNNNTNQKVYNKKSFGNKITNCLSKEKS